MITERTNTMSGIRHMPRMTYEQIYREEWEREFGRPIKRRPLIDYLDYVPDETLWCRLRSARFRERRRAIGQN